MNPDNTEKTDLEPIAPQAPPKRSYSPRVSKQPTIASLNEQIKRKKAQQEAIQGEIDELTAKRNTLFVAESELLGLMEVLADPDRAAWLAKKVDESNRQRN